MENRLISAGLFPVAGADEAGRGACAGPLVAAACILSQKPHQRPKGLTDSKLLTSSARETLCESIKKQAVAWSVVSVSALECDQLGIQEANLQALRRALWALQVRPGYALTDGFPVSGLGFAGLAVWKGDQMSASIAAASILAKVTRDHILDEMAKTWPQYGFEVHKGYATKAHQQALETFGPCPQHRRSYANVAKTDRVVKS